MFDSSFCVIHGVLQIMTNMPMKSQPIPIKSQIQLIHNESHMDMDWQCHGWGPSAPFPQLFRIASMLACGGPSVEALEVRNSQRAVVKTHWLMSCSGILLPKSSQIIPIYWWSSGESQPVHWGWSLRSEMIRISNTSKTLGIITMLGKFNVKHWWHLVQRVGVWNAPCPGARPEVWAYVASLYEFGGVGAPLEPGIGAWAFPTARFWASPTESVSTPCKWSWNHVFWYGDESKPFWNFWICLYTFDRWVDDSPYLSTILIISSIWSVGQCWIYDDMESPESRVPKNPRVTCTIV